MIAHAASNLNRVVTTLYPSEGEQNGKRKTAHLR